MVAGVVGALYEKLLSYDDLQSNYIMNSKINRNSSLLNANREGIFSVAGYLSIYLASVSIGKVVNWKARTSMQDWMEYAWQTFIQVLILWGFYAFTTSYCDIQPCRRTANISYVLLMIALNYSLMWFQMFLAFFQVCLQHVGLIYGPIVFYELKKYHSNPKRKLESLYRLNKDFRKVKQEDSDELDRKLKELEERQDAALEMIKNFKPGGPSKVEIFQEIVAIENEIEELEGRLEEEASDGGYKMKGLESNKVLLPDLSMSPVILEAIAFNGLAVFLLGNLLTGLINCLVYTMYTSTYLSVCYLWLYATVISTVSLTLFWFRIQLKFW